MSALAARRNTPERTTELVTAPLLTNIKAYQGAMAVIDTASGYYKPGVTGTGLVAVGRFEETVDTTGIASGVSKARVRPGIFRWGNSGSSDAIAIANCGAPCFIVDDQTVALTDGSSTRSVAGTIVDVDTGGVWVRMGSVNGTSLASEITAREALGSATLAANALSPGVYKTFEFTVTDGATADIPFVLGPKVKVVDVTIIKTAGAGDTGDTITVKNGSTAITDAMSIAVADKTVVRAGTIDDAQYVVSAGATLNITRTKASAANVACKVFIHVVGQA